MDSTNRTASNFQPYKYISSMRAPFQSDRHHQKWWTDYTQKRLSANYFSDVIFLYIYAHIGYAHIRCFFVRSTAGNVAENAAQNAAGDATGLGVFDSNVNKTVQSTKSVALPIEPTVPAKPQTVSTIQNENEDPNIPAMPDEENSTNNIEP